ncbi:MAG: RHS repeat protein [Oligoflexia bacterium]|nr:RHS repeat protein [Oligoflexia bacterium]
MKRQLLISNLNKYTFYMFFFLTISISTLSVFTSKCLADINPQNGNFFISFVDINVPSSNNLNINRVYNSNVYKIGWFGLGWGNYFETKLAVGADGSIVVYENGTGAESRFIPTNGSLAVDQAAKNILEGIKKKTNIAKHIEPQLLEKFKNDSRLRQFYAEELKISADIPNGATFKSNDLGGLIQTIKKTEKGFERVTFDGKNEFFALTGELQKIKHPNGYTLDLTYDLGILKKIKDSEGKELFFDWFSDKRVKYIWSPNDPKKVTYNYEDGKLVESIDVTGLTHKYTYDGNFLLSSVTYPDKTKIEISYQLPLKLVKEFKDRDNNLTTYSYGQSKTKPDLHYWTTITYKSPSSASVVTKKLEYERKRSADGQDYDYRISSEENGLKSETIYDEKRRPIEQSLGKLITKYSYYENGQIKEKRSNNGLFYKYEYHPANNKITKVENFYGTTKYEYNKNGLLTSATTYRGINFTLQYDHKGLMSTLIQEDTITKDKKVLNFKYNIMNRPTEMEIEKIGKIMLEYNNFGIVKTVDPKSNKNAVYELNKTFALFSDTISVLGLRFEI